LHELLFVDVVLWDSMTFVIGVSKILQWKGFTSMGVKFRNEVQGQSPGKGSWGQSPQKLKQNVKLVYNF